MLNVKEAAKIAYDYFTELYQGKYTNLSVEEAEMCDEETHWEIILGFDTQSKHSMSTGSTAREYKKIRIDADSGRVTSMKHHRL